ncbi:MAG TPA: replication factor C small subunit [Candidatus Thermoplasmatota archaeon]|nr:replication factor C small subunit [Candidatus Thermoplasmatota archaeon]
MDEIWVEKYRPLKLADVVGQEEVTSRLQAYVKSGNMPHLLFAGPAGTGKTTSAIALARELFGEDWRQNFQELNASDERGIDVVRGKIKEFARTSPLGGASFKIIFLDEADALTDDAQSALRRTMERFAGTARFVLSCNYSSRLIEPIQSRCAVFRFRPLKPEDITKMVRKVAKEEKLEVSKDGLEALLYVASGDMRRAINTLQVAGSLGKEVTEESIYKVTATARPEEVKAMLESALKGDFLKARDALDTMLVTYGLSGEDVLKQVHRAVFELPIPDDVKVDLVDRVGEADFRLVEGASERIQIEALLARFALAGGKLGAKKR